MKKTLALLVAFLATGASAQTFSQRAASKVVFAGGGTDLTNTIAIKAPAQSLGGITLTLPPNLGSNLQALTTDGAGQLSWTTVPTGAGGGTVSSVAISMPTALFISPVSGSPVTGSGTFAPALKTVPAGYIFAGPVSGADATPTFRPVDASDIPGQLVTSVGGTFFIKNIAGTTANQNLETDPSGAVTLEELTMPYSGSIAAISVFSNGARTGGTATFTVYINNVVTSVNVKLDAVNTAHFYTTGGTDAFVAGDRVSVKVTTVGWTPTSADMVCQIFVHFD